MAHRKPSSIKPLGRQTYSTDGICESSCLFHSDFPLKVAFESHNVHENLIALEEGWELTGGLQFSMAVLVGASG